DPERFARFTAIADHLVDACARSPVLIGIDDVHAADPGALLLARFVVRTLARQPLMLLLASRIADAPVWADSDATIVPLGPRAATARGVVGPAPDAGRILRHAAALGSAPVIGEVSAVARAAPDAVHRALS